MPFIEAFLNIGFSIGLGYFFGLSGIIIGVLISLVVSAIIWKPLFLFKEAFHISPKRYFGKYIKYIIIIVISLLVLYGLEISLLKNINTIIALFIKIFLFSIVSLLIFVLSEKQMKMNILYVGNLVKKKSFKTEEMLNER
jgi:hypothetical protein